MSPQFIRAVFAILAIRAIFISPVNGSEFGPSARPGDSLLKRIDAIRPSRLRFTKPCAPSAAQEQLDCIDGGDDGNDDERTRPAETSVEAWPLGRSPRLDFTTTIPAGTLARGFVRLRC